MTATEHIKSLPRDPGRFRVAVVLGTRPEAIKLAPVVHALEAWPDLFEPVVIATSQQREMFAQAMAAMQIRPDVDLGLTYGRGGEKAEGLHALEYVARLYWYTVEFGLVRTAAGLRIYGAGILSSPSKVSYALSSPLQKRIGFGVERVMRTRYKIDTFQQTYFVIDDFGQLFRETEPDFTPLYQRIAGLEPYPADTLLQQDQTFEPFED